MPSQRLRCTGLAAVRLHGDHPRLCAAAKHLCHHFSITMYDRRLSAGARTHKHTHTHSRAYTHETTHTHTLTHTHTHTHAHTHAHTHTHTHTRTHTFSQPRADG